MQLIIAVQKVTRQWMLSLVYKYCPWLTSAYFGCTHSWCNSLFRIQGRQPTDPLCDLQILGFPIKKNPKHYAYFHLLQLKDWCASKICLAQRDDFQTMKFCSWHFKLWIWQNIASKSSVEVWQPPNMHFLPECHWNAFILIPASPCHGANRNSLWWNLRPIPKRTTATISSMIFVVYVIA